MGPWNQTREHRTFGIPLTSDMIGWLRSTISELHCSGLDCVMIGMSRTCQKLSQSRRQMVNDWEPWLTKHIPASGRHALDLGANVGQWAAHLSSRFDRVTSLEPNA